MQLHDLSLLNQKDTCWKQIYSSLYILIVHNTFYYFISMHIEATFVLGLPWWFSG